jgi:hypothetical protein
MDSHSEWADAPLMRSTDERLPHTHGASSEDLSERSLALLDAQAEDLEHFIRYSERRSILGL